LSGSTMPFRIFPCGKSGNGLRYSAHLLPAARSSSIIPELDMADQYRAIAASLDAQYGFTDGQEREVSQ